MTIKKYEAVYAPEVAAIYNHHVRETTVSFETADVTPAEMGARLEAIASMKEYNSPKIHSAFQISFGRWFLI